MHKASFLFFLIFLITAGLAEAKRYGVQAGAFKNMAHAQERLDIVKTKGYEARIITTNGSRDTIRYKVVTGSHASKWEARDSEYRLRKILPYDFFIVALPDSPASSSNIRVPPIIQLQSIRVMLPPVPVEAAPAISADELLLDQGPRERNLALARIAAREGKLPKALTLYRELRKKYPEDTEILADLTETLIDAGEFGAALAILLPWQKQEPKSPAPLRELGRLHLATSSPEQAASLFDRITKMTPDDPRAFADAGYARLESGDWEGALDCFSRVLDQDPGDENAARIVAELIEAHRPRLETGLTYTRQSSGKRLRQRFTRWTTHTGPLTRLSVTASDLVTEGSDFSDVHRNSFTLLLAHDPNNRLHLHAGLGQNEDLGISSALGLAWKPQQQKTLTSSLILNDPWTTSLEAPGLDGTYWKIQAGYAASLSERQSVTCDIWHTGYMLNKTSPYADEYGMEASLTRRLHEIPDLSASYTFRRTWLSYTGHGSRPIDMSDESAHTLGLRYARWISPAFGFGIGAGAGLSEFKQGLLLTLDPWFTIRWGRRVCWETHYSYTSQSASQSNEGSYTLDTSLRLIF